MGSDYFFRMGSTHAVCQDYAIAGESGLVSYAMLSDGCSGQAIPGQPGSPYTDFGARFLVRSAQRYLPEMARGIFPTKAIVHDAQAIAHQARLPDVALDATLLVAVALELGLGVQTYHTGDGVVASRKRDGTLQFYSLEFGNNMPYYLSYQLSTPRRESYFSPPPELVASVEDSGKLFVTQGVKPPGGAWDVSHSTHVVHTDEPVVSTFSLEEYELVLLLSDGATSFHLKNGAPIPLEDVLDQVLAIKGLTGEFLTRRCHRFLQKFCVDNGWQHCDDFSVAGIHCGKP